MALPVNQRDAKKLFELYLNRTDRKGVTALMRDMRRVVGHEIFVQRTLEKWLADDNRMLDDVNWGIVQTFISSDKFQAIVGKDYHIGESDVSTLSIKNKSLSGNMSEYLKELVDIVSENPLASSEQVDWTNVPKIDWMLYCFDWNGELVAPEETLSDLDSAGVEKAALRAFQASGLLPRLGLGSLSYGKSDNELSLALSLQELPDHVLSRFHFGFASINLSANETVIDQLEKFIQKISPRKILSQFAGVGEIFVLKRDLSSVDGSFGAGIEHLEKNITAATDAAGWCGKYNLPFLFHCDGYQEISGVSAFNFEYVHAVDRIAKSSTYKVVWAHGGIASESNKNCPSITTICDQWRDLLVKNKNLIIDLSWSARRFYKNSPPDCLIELIAEHDDQFILSSDFVPGSEKEGEGLKYYEVIESYYPLLSALPLESALKVCRFNSLAMINDIKEISLKILKSKYAASKKK